MSLKKSTRKRRELFDKQKGICAICGLHMVFDKDEFRSGHLIISTIDHIIPKSEGGDNKIENLQCTHFICNDLKGSSKTISEERLKTAKKIVRRGLKRYENHLAPIK